MFFYRYFAGFGRDGLADAFSSADPFALAPTDIVERVLAQGLGPEVTEHHTEMWPTIGRVFEVRREEQDFLVGAAIPSIVRASFAPFWTRSRRRCLPNSTSTS